MKIISISVPGFGLSEGPPVSSAINLTQFANDVAAVADKEEAKHFHLVGYGAGGIHAAAAAFGNMKRVHNFLLIAPSTPASIGGVDRESAPDTLRMKQIWALPFIGNAVAWAVGNFMNAQTRFGLDQKFTRDMQQLQNDAHQINMNGQVLDLSQFLFADQDHSVSHTWRAISHARIVDKLPFELNDVRVQGSMAVAFSLDDAVNPAAMSRWYCDRIPGCELIEHGAGYGHRFPLALENVERALRFVKHGQRGDS